MSFWKKLNNIWWLKKQLQCLISSKQFLQMRISMFILHLFSKCSQIKAFSNQAFFNCSQLCKIIKFLFTIFITPEKTFVDCFFFHCFEVVALSLLSINWIEHRLTIPLVFIFIIAFEGRVKLTLSFILTSQKPWYARPMCD